jgi:hypothetical protein
MARRQAGHFGPADLLVIVLIADAAQNGLGKGYSSVTEGLALVLTIVAWEYLLDWMAWRFPATRSYLKPPGLALIRDGRLILQKLRKEMITEDELKSHLREQLGRRRTAQRFEKEVTELQVYRLIDARHNSPGHSVLHDLRDGSAPEGKYGRSAGHSLDHDEPEGLRPVDREKQSGRLAEKLGLRAFIDFVYKPDVSHVQQWRDDLLEVGFIHSTFAAIFSGSPAARAMAMARSGRFSGECPPNVLLRAIAIGGHCLKAATLRPAQLDVCSLVHPLEPLGNRQANRSVRFGPLGRSRTGPKGTRSARSAKARR